MMKTLPLPLAGYGQSLSKIILGTAGFGTRIPESTSMKLMDAYAEAGGTCLDTARVYGKNADGLPVSEQVIGTWLKTAGMRDKMTIISKGAHFDPGKPHISRVTPSCIEEDIEKSLESLRADTVDLYFLHRDNPREAVENIMPVLHRYVKAGHIKMLGASNWSTERILKANCFARENGMTPFCTSEIQWTLADINPEEDVFSDLPRMTGPEYLKYRGMQIPVLAWSPQAGGIFSSILAGETDSIREKTRLKYYTPLTLKRAENVRRVCRQYGITPTQAVLGYVLCNPLPAAAIVGPSTLEHLADSLTAADLELPPEAVSMLTE